MHLAELGYGVHADPQNHANVQVLEMMLLRPAEIKGKPIYEFFKLILATLVSSSVLRYTELTKEHYIPVAGLRISTIG